MVLWSITVNEFNPYCFFDSSPLFDFSISSDCGDKTPVIFHRWQGRVEREIYYDEDFNQQEKITLFDETDLTKINGNYFCYKHISYKDLLGNGQIIKNVTECPSEYSKNCGRIDTLGQKLCIKDAEKCPLYDVGLGYQSDTDNYIINEGNSQSYYNKDGYNKPDKKIIGKLMLNQGQPCYYPLETLWTQFDRDENALTHLSCKLEIFDKYEDDRYELRGNITYKKLYKENLNQRCRDLVMDNINGDEVVYLYKREFYGIDKECDAKYNLNKDTF